MLISDRYIKKNHAKAIDGKWSVKWKLIVDGMRGDEIKIRDKTKAVTAEITVSYRLVYFIELREGWVFYF